MPKGSGKRRGKSKKGIEETGFPGVFRRRADDGSEQLFTLRGRDHRSWDPRRSKLAAYILKGAPELPFKNDSHVLYLGAASGTTASHIADLCQDGLVYCVEFSKRSFRDLITTCEAVRNMVPILANARTPDQYAPLVGKVDIVYQDIAQRDQAPIFLKNMKAFMRPTKGKHRRKVGNGILMVKARSIDVARSPRKVFAEVVKELEEEVQILDTRPLGPLEKDHLAVLVTF